MRRKMHPIIAGSIAAAFVFGATAAGATTLTDASGDFLDSYSGPRAGDLDVTSVGAHRSGDQVLLTADMAGALGTTAGAAYVWGINRGAGVEPFPNFDPPTGKGVFFDAYVIVSGDGTGTLTNLLTGARRTLDPASIHIDGNELTVSLSAGLLPSEGLAFGDYLYNFWPRFAPDGVVPTNNRQISDFAPDDSSFAAAAPEPAAWATMLGGFGMVGGMMRSRRAAAVKFA